MTDVPNIATIGALLGDRTRARMLAALMGGKALTATELALDGGVSASTASSHLTRLTAAGIVVLAKQGRHRYFRIAGPEIAAVLEALTNLAGERTPEIITGPGESGLRLARVCYDHLAGEMAIRLLASLRTRGFISGDNDELALTPTGEVWSATFGIDIQALRGERRPLCRSCLDWSERRTHLAGAFGAAILERILVLRYARRGIGTRALSFSARGVAFVEHLNPGK